MRQIRIEINGQDITRFLEKKNFPKSLVLSVKRTGFFAWQAKPFTFRIIDPTHSLTITRLHPALVYLEAGVRINGYIAKIEDPDTDTPQITINPNIMRLKDVTVGTANSDGEKIFQSNGYKKIREIVNLVLQEVGNQTGLTFPPATTTEIPDECDTPNMGLSGYVLRRVKRGPDILKRMLIKLVFGWLQDIEEPGAHLRKKDNTVYYIEEGAGFESRLWIREATLINWSFKKSWKVLGVSFGFDFGTFRIPSHDWYIPTFKAYYHIFRCMSGQLESVGADLSWGTIWPFDDPTPNLQQTYGPKYNGEGTCNISTKMLGDYASETGLTSYEKLAWFDYDSLNSYALIYGKRLNEIVSDLYLISFQTPLDNNFKVIYRDAKAIDIIKDLAIAGYRYLYLDGRNRIFMPGRGTEMTAATALPDRAKKEEKVTRKSIDRVSVPINRYSENSSGGVSSWGIVMSQKESDALKRFYSDLWDQKEQVQTIRKYHFELVESVPDLLTTFTGDIIVSVSEPLNEEDLLTINTERLEDV